MAFQTRHYEVLARIFGESLAESEQWTNNSHFEIGVKHVLARVIDELIADNFRFKRVVFEDRVGQWRRAKGGRP